MQSDVEFREVEAEDLDHPLERGNAPVGDAAPAVLREAAADQAQIVQELLGLRVAVVPEPPPHEGELPAVRLELVACSDLGGVGRQLGLVARERLVELGQHVDERSCRGDLDGQRAHLRAVALECNGTGALERLGDRGRPRRRVAVHVAADPRPENEWWRRVGNPLTPLAEQLRGRGEQAVLEEPEAVPDLVRDPQAVVPHFVGLPEQCHLLGDPLLDLVQLRREEPRVVEPVELLRDADMCEQHGAPRRLGRVRGEHEPDRRPAGRSKVGVGEEPEGVLERLTDDPAVACILPPSAQAMQLLREVRELEIEPKRAQDECLLVRGKRGVDVGDDPFAPRALCAQPDLLDVLEQLRPFLLDEHLAQDRPEQPDVPAQRSRGVHRRL